MLRQNTAFPSSLRKGSALHSPTSRRRKEFNASEPYKIPMECSDCIHYSYCMERRGFCREFKTLETIRREIIDINNAYKAEAASGATAGDKAADPQKSLRRRDMDP